jgi:hypothetical protein
MWPARRVGRPSVDFVGIVAVFAFACAPGRTARDAGAEASRSVAPVQSATPAAEPTSREEPAAGAAHAEALTPQPSTTTAATPPPTTSREALLERARAQLLEVASADFTNVRERTSHLLYTLADLARMMDPGATKQRDVQEIRFQAERVARTDASFVRTVWIERALLAALSVLEESAAAARLPELDDWITTARSAVNAIPDHSSLAFDQAPIQDALRATVTAFAAARMARGTSPAEHAASEGR